MSQYRLFDLDPSDPGSESIRFDDPEYCPLCVKYIQPRTLNGIRYPFDEEIDRLRVIFQCPSCNEPFIGCYEYYGYYKGLEQFGSYKFYPQSVERKEVNEEIKKVSPEFINIYNQALTADNMKLQDIAGPGYRKALEFLMKDYLKALMPEQTDKIEKMALAKCISDLVDNTKIKETAKRAAWLGNDETHYRRKWENFDVTHMKTLVDLTVNWIEAEFLYKKFLEDMPEPK